MMRQQGKINFTGLIMLLIIVYAGYAAVKLIVSNASETQIRKEVIDMLGTMRGADFSESEAVTAIKDILLDHSVVFDEEDEQAVSVSLNKTKGTITFYYTYDEEINFLFFKKKKTVKVKEGLKSYD